MKNFILIIFILILLFSGKAEAQINLIPNPGFEIYDTCPDNLSQISRAAGWFSSRLSPDYFNTCASSSSWASIPSNYWGYQWTISGNGYAGFAAKYGGDESVKEFISIQLASALQINTKYYVSFKVCRAFKSNFMNDCSVNKLGALFTTTQYSMNTPAPICNCAQVYSDSVITDTLNWTLIAGSFFADSNYTYVNFGNFFTSLFTDSLQNQGTFCNAYYYIDEICVSDDSSLCTNYFTGINEQSNTPEFSCFPNPAADFMKFRITQKGNFRVKLNDFLGQNLKIIEIKNENTIVDLSDIAPGNYLLILEKDAIPIHNSIISKL